MTKWVAALDYEGHYEVSDDGQVRSIDRIVRGRSDSARLIKGVLLRPKVNSRNHYLEVNLGKLGKHRMHRVNRLVLESFIPKPSEISICCHNNGIRSDNRLSNLRWGTPSENMYDKRGHGTDHEVAKSHCKRGHLFVAENMYPRGLRHGHRICISCLRARGRVNYRGGDLVSISHEIYKALTGLEPIAVSAR